MKTKVLLVTAIAGLAFIGAFCGDIRSSVQNDQPGHDGLAKTGLQGTAPDFQSFASHDQKTLPGTLVVVPLKSLKHATTLAAYPHADIDSAGATLKTTDGYVWQSDPLAHFGSGTDNDTYYVAAEHPSVRVVGSLTSGSSSLTSATIGTTGIIKQAKRTFSDSPQWAVVGGGDEAARGLALSS